MGKKITVLYGTETGNSESLADEFAKAAKAKGHDVELAAASQKNINDLKSIENCVVVISTWEMVTHQQMQRNSVKRFTQQKKMKLN